MLNAALNAPLLSRLLLPCLLSYPTCLPLLPNLPLPSPPLLPTRAARCLWSAVWPAVAYLHRLGLPLMLPTLPRADDPSLPLSFPAAACRCQLACVRCAHGMATAWLLARRWRKKRLTG